MSGESFWVEIIAYHKTCLNHNGRLYQELGYSAS